MTELKLMAAILNSMSEPVVFVDTQHIIRYMNKVACSYFKAGKGLIGTSVLDCHKKSESHAAIKKILAAMQAGTVVEELITDNEKKRIYMRAVCDDQGQVIGYYERYTLPGSQPPVEFPPGSGG